MKIDNWVPVADLSPETVESLCLQWALDPDTGVAYPNVFTNADPAGLVSWDGYGCDCESMPPNMLYISSSDYMFAREWFDGSLIGVRGVLADVDPEAVLAAFNADYDKFDRESPWVCVS